jgi:hypothetical protein
MMGIFFASFMRLYARVLQKIFSARLLVRMRLQIFDSARRVKALPFHYPPLVSRNHPRRSGFPPVMRQDGHCLAQMGKAILFPRLGA